MSKENWPHQIPDDDLRCKLLAAALREKETGTIGSFNRRERKDGESLIDSLDIERLHQQSFIQYVGDRLKEKEFSERKFRILDIGSGPGVYADQLREKFGDRIKIFTTGLSKRNARKYRHGEGIKDGLITSPRLPNNYLKWHSILELNHEDERGVPTEEFDLILNTVGEIPHGIRSGNQDKEIEYARAYLGMIIAKLRPGGLASIFPASPLVLETADALDAEHPEISISSLVAVRNHARLQIQKLNDNPVPDKL